MTEFDTEAKALFEYENGTGFPRGIRWEKADFLTKARYRNKVRIVLAATGSKK